ncbi:ABC transporter substrate-binding protein [Streptomyces sp. 1222.5]|uniref:ABC transporter substrate-binding protein n=1 Tax=Streptomyces sp. 1222.5 TaxID=1881026 RepID=UPI003EBDBF01
MKMRRRYTFTCTGFALVFTFGATACSVSLTGDEKSLDGQTVSVSGVWTGSERENFEKVLSAFTAKTGAKTTYTSTGANVSDSINEKFESGNLPDVVMVPQVGTLRQFAKDGWLQALSPEVNAIAKSNYSQAWIDYGTFDNKLYGLFYKAADKSTVWFNPRIFRQVGASEPVTFEEMLAVGRQVKASRLAGFTVAGKDGWTLTDWFENIYLSQAGPTKYDALSTHAIKWTDSSVVKALTTLSRLFGDSQQFSGGQREALRTGFTDSVGKVFGPQPEAAMVYEGDFVAGVAHDRHGKTSIREIDFFPFPSVSGGEPPIVGGGDAAVVLKDGKNPVAGMELVKFLGTPEAAAIWAKEGGFLSPNERLDLDSYNSILTSAVAQSFIHDAENVRLDMSDQTPAAFGGTEGAGERKILQDFLRDPSDPRRTAAALEASAAKAYQETDR